MQYDWCNVHWRSELELIEFIFIIPIRIITLFHRLWWTKVTPLVVWVFFACLEVHSNQLLEYQMYVAPVCTPAARVSPYMHLHLLGWHAHLWTLLACLHVHPPWHVLVRAPTMVCSPECCRMSSFFRLIFLLFEEAWMCSLANLFGFLSLSRMVSINLVMTRCCTFF